MYQGVSAVPTSGKGTLEPLGGAGGIMGSWGCGVLCAGGPGLGGPCRG